MANVHALELNVGKFVDTGSVPKPRRGRSLLVRNLEDFLASIVTAGTDVMTQMRFAGCRLYRQRRIAQEIVCPAHIAF